MMGWTNLRGVGNEEEDALATGLIFGDVRYSNGFSSFDKMAETDIGLTGGAVGGIKLVKGGKKEPIEGNSCGAGFNDTGEYGGKVKLLLSCIGGKGGLYEE